MKQEVINTLQVRRMRAILMRTWMITVESPSYKVSEKKKEGYLESTTGKQGHGQGILDYHIFAAVLRVALESRGVDGEDMKLLRQHREEFTAPSHYRNKVKHCKLGSAYDSNVRRLEIILSRA